MATKTTKRGRPSKEETEQKKRAVQRERERQRRTQQTAVALFALGVILVALCFIPGAAVWEAVRTALFGVLGVCAYFAGPFVLYIAVRCAYDKLPAGGRIARIALLLLSVSGAFYVFGDGGAPAKFTEAVAYLYTLGAQRLGGGAISVVLGWALEVGCGLLAAKIIVTLLLIVSLMLIAEKSLFDILEWIKGTAGGINERMKTAAQEAAARENEAAQIKENDDDLPWREKKKADIDVPLGTENSRIDIPLGSAPAPAAQEAPQAAASPAAQPPAADPADDARVRAIEEAVHRKADRADVRTKTSAIDIPLGPEFDPKRTGLSDIDTLTPHPAGPAAVVVGDIFDREAKVGRMFTDFSGDTAGVSVDELIRRASEKKTAAPALTEETPPAEKPAYRFPPVSLLQKPAQTADGDVTTEMRHSAELLVSTLESFGVRTRVINISRGPAVTRYELQPEAGVRLSRIVNLADDIALNLAALGVRIEAPIPGKPAVGIEVPNKTVNIVNIRSVIESDAYRNAKSPITFALGKDIAGDVRVADLAKMPHLLIAGSTGMGKSVCINSMIMSFVYKAKPEELQLILIDPKIVEFNCYSGLPHLYVPVVTDPHKAAGALGSAVGEMLRRYKLFSDYGTRNIDEYNKKVERDYPPEKEMPDGQERPEKKPRIVIVIDELADLMMTSPREVEDAICRIAQMGRAAGIHLVVATQRPSVDVITGVIKNNIPTRIAFAVSSQVDSRTILDGAGAEKLIGKGDMLFLPVGNPKPTRIQGCYVSDEEVEKVVGFLKQFGAAQYNEQFMRQIEENASKDKSKGAADENDIDPMLEQAIEVVVEAGQASTSLLQRRLRLGYARAARIVDEMEQMGIVGPADGSKPRAVLMTRQQWQERTLTLDARN
ncbi:MAG: DNA translocase FtsK [Oscillospiraceae bacterium]|nr:DNA translocase FtsK [Oscillospiraceae bacterium]